MENKTIISEVAKMVTSLKENFKDDNSSFEYGKSDHFVANIDEEDAKLYNDLNSASNEFLNAKEKLRRAKNTLEARKTVFYDHLNDKYERIQACEISKNLGCPGVRLRDGIPVVVISDIERPLDGFLKFMKDKLGEME